MPWSVPVVPTVPQTNSISTWQSTSPPPEQVAPSPAPDPAPAFGGFNFGQPVGGGGFNGFGAMPMAPLNANPMPDYSNPTPPYDPNPTPPQYDTGAGAMQPMGFGGMGMFGGMPPLGGGGMMPQTPMMEQQPPMMQPASNPAPPARAFAHTNGTAGLMCRCSARFSDRSTCPTAACKEGEQKEKSPPGPPGLRGGLFGTF